MNHISYSEGYKYVLESDYEMEIPILPEQDISIRFIKLTKKGLLTIRRDYAFDGASGPTADTPSTMRAACVHDALYALLRSGQLDPKYRGVADLIFRNILLEDGVFPPRAELFYRGVATFGEPFIDPKSEKPLLTAP